MLGANSVAAWLVGSTLVRRGVMGWQRGMMPISSMTLASSSCVVRTEAAGPSWKKLWEEVRVPFGLQSLPQAAFRLRRSHHSANELTTLLCSIKLRNCRIPTYLLTYK